MKLRYYKDAHGNFGDDLNPWLWDRLIPDAFDGRDDVLFLGIGTILNGDIPAGPTKLVFGSGTGYHSLPAVDQRWKFYCVRGPRTAASLSLPPETAVTDAAALVATIIPPTLRRSGVGFMPHHVSASLFDWKPLCRRLGLVYLDPAAPVDRTLSTMARLECVIADAMHGAIVADALRVPWIPVSLYAHTNEFKWLDWCDSLAMKYSPVKCDELSDNSSQRPARRMRAYLQRFRRTGDLTRIGRREAVTPSPREAVERVAQQLSDLRSDLARASLSDDHIFARRVQELCERLALFRSEWLGSPSSRQPGTYQPAAPRATVSASSW